jgi:trk system potassium uptake protein TrkH
MYTPLSWRISAFFRDRTTPDRLLVASFLFLILFGTVGLKVLPGLYTGPSLSWIDALFTSTSAVCVTGLIVVDTGSFFTHAGQAFILLLIQLGGLGILTFATLAILAWGGRVSLHQEALALQPAEVLPQIDVGTMVKRIVLFTLTLEGIGAALLFLLWLGRFSPGQAAWHAIFHAVSAFCNAGFSTFQDSLTQFAASGPVLVVVMALIVLGGLGFVVLEELREWIRRRPETKATLTLTLHSKLVLVTTAILILLGAVLFSALEWNNVLAGFSPLGRVLNAFFMSVTPRTAGFNTVDYSTTSDSTNFLTILLMSVGGSPGSTAGGIKTTTVALVVLLASARLRGKGTPSAFRASVAPDTVERAVGVMVLTIGAMTLGIWLISVTELGGNAHTQAPGEFIGHMFEMVSAFNTVGLSMGVTSHLSFLGKLITVALMFLGRLGLLTVGLALARRGRLSGDDYRYAYEEVMIG